MQKKKPASPATAVELDSPADRIRYLLKYQWADNQNEMARAIGCSQATISRAVRDEIQPGKRLLRLIAAHPAVNAEWLYRGRGKPLVPEEKQGASQDVRLPLVTALAANFPNELRPNPEGTDFPVAHALHAPSRCWYRLSDGATILRHTDVALLPNDLLLLDYDISRFSTLFELSGRIAVAWVHPALKGADQQLEIGVLDYCKDPDGESLELVTGEPNPARWKGVKLVEARLTYKDKSTGKDVDFGSQTVPAWVDSKGMVKPISANELQRESYSIQHSDLVAVCVGMFRQ